MKFIKDFNTYLLQEAFDLNKMYQQHRIIEPIRKEAQEITNSYFSGVNDVPADIDSDKLELWLAKQIKAFVIKLTTVSVNRIYNSGEHEHLEAAQGLLNYFKGKEVSPEILELPIVKDSITDILNNRFISNYNTRLNGIFDYFLSPMRNIHEPINFVSSTLDEMDDIQYQWHQSLKGTDKILEEEGNVIKTFKDGFYWIDLQTNSCTKEAAAMGHCGRTNADTILSLRKKSDAGHIQPYVTVAIDYNENKETYNNVRQIKGKGNTKPVERYHPYIIELLSDKNLGITKLSNDEYSSENDFHIVDIKDNTIIKKLIDQKPTLFNSIKDIIILYERKLITEDEGHKLLPSGSELILTKNGYYLPTEIMFLRYFYRSHYKMKFSTALRHSRTKDKSVEFEKHVIKRVNQLIDKNSYKDVKFVRHNDKIYIKVPSTLAHNDSYDVILNIRDARTEKELLEFDEFEHSFCDN